VEVAIPCKAAGASLIVFPHLAQPQDVVGLKSLSLDPADQAAAEHDANRDQISLHVSKTPGRALENIMPYSKTYCKSWTLTTGGSPTKKPSRTPSPDSLSQTRGRDRRFGLGETAPEKQPVQHTQRQKPREEDINPGYAVALGTIPPRILPIKTDGNAIREIEDETQTRSPLDGRYVESTPSLEFGKAEDQPVDLSPHGIEERDFACTPPHDHSASYEEFDRRSTYPARRRNGLVTAGPKLQSSSALASEAVALQSSLSASASGSASDIGVEATKPLPQETTSSIDPPNTAREPAIPRARYTRAYPSNWTVLAATSSGPTPASTVVLPKQPPQEPQLRRWSEYAPLHRSSATEPYPLTVARVKSSGNSEDEGLPTLRSNRVSIVSSQYSTTRVSSRDSSFSRRLYRHSSGYSTGGIASRHESLNSDGQGEARRRRVSSMYSTYDDDGW
jgi:hypothetical protein